LASVPPNLRLNGSVSGAGAGQEFGGAVAATETYVAVGNPKDSDLANEGGAVHVYSAKTGKRLRTLRPSDPEDGANFGASVAISGIYAIIGAPKDDGNLGSAYVFDVKTGRELMKIPSTASEVNSFFGQAVDLEGTLAVIGAWSDDLAGGNAGAVTLLRIDTKAKSFTMLFHGAVAETLGGDAFGYSVALSGETLLVGAPGRSTQTGAVYLLNALTGVQIDKSVASDGAVNDRFGWAVDLRGDRALVGSPQAVNSGGTIGAAYVFRFRDGNQLHKLFSTVGGVPQRFGEAVALHERTSFVGAPGAFNDFTDAGAVFAFEDGDLVGDFPVVDRNGGDEYGSALAFAGNVLVVGAPGAMDLPGFAAGAAYLNPVISQPLSGSVAEVYAQAKDSAPGVADATYRSFSRILMRYNRNPLILANLAGSGAPRGQNVGLYADWNDLWSLRLRTGDVLGPLKINRISNPVDLYGADQIMMQVRGTGTGINSGNDEALVRDDGTSLAILLREGDDLTTGGFTGQRLGVMGPVLGNNETSEAMLFSSLKSGAIPVGATGNSCVLAFDPNPFGIVSSVIEGTPTPIAGVSFGQVYSRFASNDSDIHVVTPLTGTGVTTADNLALWRKPLNASPAVLTARKGDAAAGGTLKAFLGEAFNYNHGIYRCSLGGVPSTQNEAIFSNSGFSLLCQEGVANAALPAGVVVSRFIRYFAASGDEGLLLVKLRGTGVNSSNDQALLYCKDSSNWQVLMREGDTAPDTGGARIGTIQQVDAEADYSGYAVVVSLTGCSKATNQALYKGNMNVFGVFGVENRNRPQLMLRKGVYQTLFGKTVSLRSIKLPVILESSGVGNRGLGSTLIEDQVMVQLTMSDNSVLVARVN
ncbi:MAG: hypothetical protein KDM64_08935, partial [Verrucomicrobiae bacterium]|nr:hypothetical protein [Verrucomicrobiae bacterium]